MFGRSRLREQPGFATAQPGVGYTDALLLVSGTDNPAYARDSSASKNHLIPGTAPTRTMYGARQSMLFATASSQYLLTSRAIRIGKAFSVVCRVTPTTTNNGYTRILDTGYTTGLYLGSNTGTQYGFIVNNSALEGCVGGQQVAGVTDVLVATFDGTSTRLYVNGTLVATGTATAPATSSVLTVGRQSGTSAGYWNGGIDTIGFFPRALSAREARQIADNPWQMFGGQARGLKFFAPSSGGSTGTLATTNANDTSAASGTTTVVGTLAKTNANDTSAASGTTTVVGTLATTNANDSVAASGSVGSAGSSGSLAYTNANDTSAASGTTTVTGTVAYTNANDSVSASGSGGTTAAAVGLQHGFEVRTARRLEKPDSRLWWARRPKTITAEQADEKLEVVARKVSETVISQVSAGKPASKSEAKKAVKAEIANMPGFDWNAFYQRAYALAAEQAASQEKMASAAQLAAQVSAREIDRIARMNDDDEAELLAMLI